MHLRNSFISTTRCDDLARATEAQDGKKNYIYVDNIVVSDFDHRWHGQHCLYATLLCIVD